MDCSSNKLAFKTCRHLREYEELFRLKVACLIGITRNMRRGREDPLYEEKLLSVSKLEREIEKSILRLEECCNRRKEE